MFQLNDRVRFFRGSLKEYFVSLPGIEGIVVSTRADAPPGCITVLVDWASSPYAERENLPVWINVPPGELELVEPKPKLSLV